MHKFLLLIRRFWNLILFIILEVISVYFIAQSRSTQGLDVINSANSIVGFFYQKEKNIIAYFNLNDVNKQLLIENTLLRNKLFEKYAVDTFKTTLANIPVIDYDNEKTPKDSSKSVTALGIILRPTKPIHIVRYAKYNFIPSRVVNNSISNDRVNYITINRGRNSGIEKGMAVVSSVGVVGRVEQVSKHFATIASVLSNRRISARLRLHESFGQVTWQSGDPAHVHMDNMPITLPVRLKDSVYTSGYSYFPANVLIGTVSHIDTLANSNSLSLEIRLSTNFRTLTFVYVVEDDLRKEKEILEKKH